MNAMKLFFYKVAAFFVSGKASKALNTAAELVPKAAPYIDIAAEIAAGLTPSTIDDAMLAQIHARFPRMFDGTINSGEEMKLYLLGIAAQLLQSRFPQVSTSIARTAVQVAYTAQHA
jgi:hypothetical protein